MRRAKLRSKARLGHPSNCSLALPDLQPPRTRRLPLAGLSHAKTAATSSLASRMTSRPSNPEPLAFQGRVRSPILRYAVIFSVANESPDDRFSLQSPPALLWALSPRLPTPASFLRDLVRRPPVSILEESSFRGRSVRKEVEIQRSWVPQDAVIRGRRCREARRWKERGGSCRKEWMGR